LRDGRGLVREHGLGLLGWSLDWLRLRERLLVSGRTPRCATVGDGAVSDFWLLLFIGLSPIAGTLLIGLLARVFS
jgi:hypothetical protein